MRYSNSEPNQVWKWDLQPMWPEALRSRLSFISPRKDVVYELNYFEAKISAILKRHCCYSNGSCVINFCAKIQIL
jgi:hypothetical protein